MDVGVLIPKDDSVRLLMLVLKQLDLNPLYQAYTVYCERRRKEEAERERGAAERGAGTLVTAEVEGRDPHPGGRSEKKKDGRPPCDIVVLLSIVLYGAMQHIYSSRALATACRQNINFMWLLQGNPPPSHGMINAFRKHLLREVIEELLYELVGLLGDWGEVRFEQVFIDGTMVEARANSHTAVWRKNVDRYEEGQKGKIRGIIQDLNRREGTAYSEAGEGIQETAKAAQGYLEMKLGSAGGAGETLSRRILKTYRKTLKEGVKKLNKYAKQRETMGKRNSYSKTDPEATFMRMKDGTLKAAYNVQLAVEGEYITGAGIFATPNDGATLKPFLEHLKQMLGTAYEKIVADAGYESEENYTYLVENEQQAYIKPTNYERMKTKKFREDISKRENMKYDDSRDEYTCANGKKLGVVRSETRVSKSGYESEVTVYAGEDCCGCPVRERCTTSKTNREMEVSKKLLAFREASRVNISSEEGILLRVNRSIQVEGAFGVTKEDSQFRRFFTRGKAGVSGELFLLCFCYNVNKLHHKIQQGRCGTSLHPLKQKAS
jgi:transposase